MRHQRTGSSSLPAILRHAGRRRNYRSILIAAVVLLVLATIWLRDSIGIDRFGPRPHPQGQLPSHDQEHGSDEVPHAQSSATSSQTATTIPSPVSNPAASTFHTSAAVSSQTSAQTASQSSESQAAQPTAIPGPSIPAKIWQILLPQTPQTGNDKHPPNQADPKEAEAWTSLNPNHTYTLLDQHTGAAFVRSHFTHTNPDLAELYRTLPDVGMKSDILRYLVLDIEGGAYSDIGTVPLKPISDWVPASLQDKVKLVVGVMSNPGEGSKWKNTTHQVHFCQWTIAAAPGHPVFGKMVARLQESIADLTERYRLPVAELSPTREDVMNSTGAVAWTEVIMEVLKGYDETLQLEDLAHVTELKLVGNVLMLPPSAFASGRGSSNATSESVPEAALVKHPHRANIRRSLSI
ncbi:glycosyltransferase [Podospora aff. communis PSN243]|uniref:Glycosyltransferase n=1 Tax=Podospora aff. communis PSN243 TaxID=3040156 RepID=A0AAV9GVN4_9PEZI|nr:glycosyltransferase [Podospora aff. communis PSN243]